VKLGNKTSIFLKYFLSFSRNKKKKAQEIRYESGGSFAHIKLHFTPTEMPFFIQFGG